MSTGPCVCGAWGRDGAGVGGRVQSSGQDLGRCQDMSAGGGVCVSPPCNSQTPSSSPPPSHPGPGQLQRGGPGPAGHGLLLPLLPPVRLSCPPRRPRQGRPRAPPHWMQLLHWSLCCQLATRGHCLAPAGDTGSLTLELLLLLATPGSHHGPLCRHGGGRAGSRAEAGGAHPRGRELPLALEGLPASEPLRSAAARLQPRRGWDPAPAEGRQPSPSKLLPKGWPGVDFGV